MQTTLRTNDLREQRRRGTLVKLHASALALAQEKGPSATTIDEIARHAEVSRRTFFNYYETKEDAILGIVPPQLTDEQMTAFLTSEVDTDPLTRAVRLIIAVGQSIRVPGVSPDDVRALIAQFPELKTAFRRYVQRTQDVVVAAMSDRFADDPSHSDNASDHALALFLTAGAVFRFMQIHDHDVTYPSSPEAVDSAVVTFRSVFKDLL